MAEDTKATPSAAAKAEVAAAPVAGPPQPVIVQGQPLAATAPPPTKAYKLKAGARHVHSGVMIPPGGTVQLTESQAKAFRDKFEPIDPGESGAAAAASGATGVHGSGGPGAVGIAGGIPASTSGVAQDIGGKTNAGSQGAVNSFSPPPPTADATTKKVDDLKAVDIHR